MRRRTATEVRGGTAARVVAVRARVFASAAVAGEVQMLEVIVPAIVAELRLGYEVPHPFVVFGRPRQGRPSLLKRWL